MLTPEAGRLYPRSPHVQLYVRQGGAAETAANARELAEREGFEPPVELPPRRISSAVHSTTLPPLREMSERLEGVGLVDTGGLMA
jgi:hypothetical protein